MNFSQRVQPGSTPFTSTAPMMETPRTPPMLTRSLFVLSIGHLRNNLKDSSTDSAAFKSLMTRDALTKLSGIGCNSNWDLSQGDVLDINSSLVHRAAFSLTPTFKVGVPGCAARPEPFQRFIRSTLRLLKQFGGTESARSPH